jgi:sensor histidine kinase regulating citrate/malate metabolism
MVGGGALVLRAGGVIALTVAAAVVLAVVLAFFKFDQKLLDVTANRLVVVAQDVRRQAEVGLTLGLDLVELDDLKSIAERAALAADVTRVDLRDIRGIVRFSSQPGRVGQPAGVGETTPGGNEAFRRVVDGDRATVVVVLRNGFGEPAGTVAVEASLKELRQQKEAVRRDLVAAAAPVIAGALAATLLAVMLTVRWSVGGRGDDNNRAADPDLDDESPDRAMKETAASLHASLQPRLAVAVAAAEQALERTAAALAIEPRGTGS